MFFHWLSLSNGLILDLDDSYNTRFNADKRDHARLQVKRMLERHLTVRGEKNEKSSICDCFIFFS